MIVSDSSPLICFAAAGKLQLLEQLLKEIVVPEAVWLETTVQGKPGSEAIKTTQWVKRTSIKAQASASRLKEQLGAGESEAIVLAQELKAPLLMDDPAARRTAKELGVALLSTKSILHEAKDAGLIAEIKGQLAELRNVGFRIGPRLYLRNLERAGEAP